ncbi:hypothetical protein BJ508DRAFT_333980 [Ascobolus immersus RN42]|uniref:Uncharacterized protein n=1 Tax=Ascobolus immersus RN42 TaxID=1160509 RepID=A0A3N4HN67_ASCIM|nr:hypothetical protein BJ508DRAFT_333980 [Ascobolus immersus RN42]
MPLPPPPTAPPVLSFHHPSTSELVPALRLLSDSIAQYRPLQNYSFFSHPLFLACYGALMSVLLAYNWHKPLGTLLLLLCGVTAGIFTLVAKTTIDFLTKAEELGSNEGLEKLKSKDCIIATWRDDVVGVIAWEESDSSSVPKEDEELYGDSDEEDGSKPKKVYVKVWGWTVRRKERGRGLGGDLLKTMIQEVRSKYSTVSDGKTKINRNIKFEFDVGNIHSVRVLPERYNWALDRNMVWSKKVLKRYSKLKDLEAPALETMN